MNKKLVYLFLLNFKNNESLNKNIIIGGLAAICIIGGTIWKFRGNKTKTQNNEINLLNNNNNDKNNDKKSSWFISLEEHEKREKEFLELVNKNPIEIERRKIAKFLRNEKNEKENKYDYFNNIPEFFCCHTGVFDNDYKITNNHFDRFYFNISKYVKNLKTTSNSLMLNELNKIINFCKQNNIITPEIPKVIISYNKEIKDDIFNQYKNEIIEIIDTLEFFINKTTDTLSIEASNNCILPDFI